MSPDVDEVDLLREMIGSIGRGEIDDRRVATLTQSMLSPSSGDSDFTRLPALRVGANENFLDTMGYGFGEIRGRHHRMDERSRRHHPEDHRRHGGAA